MDKTDVTTTEVKTEAPAEVKTDVTTTEVKTEEKFTDSEWREQRLNKEIGKKKELQIKVDAYEKAEGERKVRADTEKGEFKTELEALTKEFTDFKTSTNESSLKSVKQSQIDKFKFSEDEAKFITGSTKEEVLESSKSLEKLLGKNKELEKARKDTLGEKKSTEEELKKVSEGDLDNFLRGGIM